MYWTKPSKQKGVNLEGLGGWIWLFKSSFLPPFPCWWYVCIYVYVCMYAYIFICEMTFKSPFTCDMTVRVLSPLPFSCCRYLHIYLSIYLYIYLSTHLSIYLSMCLSLYIYSYVTQLSKAHSSLHSLVATIYIYVCIDRYVSIYAYIYTDLCWCVT